MAESVLWENVFEGGTSILWRLNLSGFLPVDTLFGPLFIARKYNLTLTNRPFRCGQSAESHEKYIIIDSEARKFP